MIKSIEMMQILLTSINIFTILLSVLLGLTTLYKITKINRNVNMMHWSRTILAHRGHRPEPKDPLAYNITENSIKAFIYAKENGADGIEIDVSLTADKQIIVMHDNTVDRTTNGSGYVSNMTLQQIKELKYKDTTGRQYTIPSDKYKDIDIQHVPTLEDTIKFCKKHNLKLMIESKEYEDPVELRKQIYALFEKYNMYSWAFVASFNPIHLYFYRFYHPVIPICYLYCNGIINYYHNNGSKEMQLNYGNYKIVRNMLDWFMMNYGSTIIADWLGASIIGPQNVLISSELIKSLTNRNMLCDVWTVNNLKEKKWLLEQGAMVTTDQHYLE